MSLFLAKRVDGGNYFGAQWWASTDTETARQFKSLEALRRSILTWHNKTKASYFEYNKRERNLWNNYFVVEEIELTVKRTGTISSFCAAVFGEELQEIK